MDRYGQVSGQVEALTCPLKKLVKSSVFYTYSFFWTGWTSKKNKKDHWKKIKKTVGGFRKSDQPVQNSSI